MFRFKRFFLIIVTLLLGISLFPSCNDSNARPQINTLSRGEIQAFADPVAENILTAMNTGNYTAYTRDFDDTLKGNLSEDNFKTVNDLRTQTVGKYLSKEFWEYTQKNEKINVAYRTTFTDEPAGVTLSLFFLNISGKWYVNGIKYDSPKMRYADC